MCTGRPKGHFEVVQKYTCKYNYSFYITVSFTGGLMLIGFIEEVF